MAKAKLKTRENQQSVAAFLNGIEPAERRKDAKKVLAMMKKLTGTKPKMWGDTMIGFGKYHYKYDSGREGEMLKIGFSPRKTALSLYIMTGFEKHVELMKKLGKYKTGKSCLYIKKLSDVDEEVLQEIAQDSWDAMNKKYGTH